MIYNRNSLKNNIRNSFHKITSKTSDLFFQIPNFSTRNYVFTAKNSKHNNHNKHKNKILNNHIRLFSLNPSQSDLPWFNVNNLKHQWSKLVRGWLNSS